MKTLKLIFILLGIFTTPMLLFYVNCMVKDIRCFRAGDTIFTPINTFDFANKFGNLSIQLPNLLFWYITYYLLLIK